jgi:peptidoglycan/xylan/chitin deacetylase (PgdA/CDA1 family)
VKQLTHRLAARGPLAALARAATAHRLRILCYHGLWTTPGFQFGDRLFMAPSQFERRMTRLKQSGLPVLSLGAAVDALAAQSLPPGATVITIDDGWASTHSHMLPVLEALHLPATLYVTSWYVGRDLPIIGKAVEYLYARSGRSGDIAAAASAVEALPFAGRAAVMRKLSASLGIPLDWWDTRQFHLMTAEEVGDAQRRGLDVQLHTHRHDGSVDTLAAELAENRALLADWTARPGAALSHYCYPSGVHEHAAEPVLAASGVRSATTTEQGTNGYGSHPLRLRRFLDGRSVSDDEFDAYLAGSLDWVDAAVARLRR